MLTGTTVEYSSALENCRLEGDNLNAHLDVSGRQFISLLRPKKQRTSVHMSKWRAVKLTVSHLCLRAGTSDQGGFEGFRASAAAARSSPIDTFPLIPPQTGSKKTARALEVDAECKKKNKVARFYQT